MRFERARLVRTLCRAMVAVAGRALPSHVRGEWMRHHLDEVAGWWMLVERGDIPPVCAPVLGFIGRASLEAVRRRLVPRSPGFALAVLSAALVVLALVTGGFAGIRALLRPLPYREPGRIVQFRVFVPFEGVQRGVPKRLLEQWKKSTAVVETFAGYTAVGRSVYVTPGFFEALGTDPAAWLRFYGFRRAVPAGKEFPEVLLAKLKPGAEPRQAWRELHEYANRVEVRPVTGVYRQPLAIACGAVAAVLVLLTVAALVLAVATRRPPRYCAFLWAKTAMVAVLYGALWLEAIQQGSGLVTRIGGPTLHLMVTWTLLVGAPGVLWWSVRDQRRRCPECLFRLTLPISIGSWSSPFLDPASTEFLCDQGHGTLYVPETGSSDREPERWMPLHASWRG